MTTTTPGGGVTPAASPSLPAVESPCLPVPVTSIRALVRDYAAIGDYDKAAEVWLGHLYDAYHLAELMFNAAILANRPSASGAAAAAQAKYAEFNGRRMDDAQAAVEGLISGWGAAG